jgi:hypothetical protein
MLTPAFSIAANLAAAVPFPPDTMAPACPIRRPGGAVTPAMKPTTGLLGSPCAFSHSQASSSALPPISPMKTMPYRGIEGFCLRLQVMYIRAARDSEKTNLGLRIIGETLKAVNEIGSVERISTNSNTSRLSKVVASCLCNSFIC